MEYCVQQLCKMYCTHIWTDVTVVSWLDLAFLRLYCMLQFAYVRFSFLGYFVLQFICVYVCLCCVRFSFFSTTPRGWLGRTSPKRPILCRVGCKTLTQSINYVTPCLGNWLEKSYNACNREQLILWWTAYSALNCGFCSAWAEPICLYLKCFCYHFVSWRWMKCVKFCWVLEWIVHKCWLDWADFWTSDILGWGCVMLAGPPSQKMLLLFIWLGTVPVFLPFHHTWVTLSTVTLLNLLITRNVGQCPTWWPSCRI